MRWSGSDSSGLLDVRGPELKHYVANIGVTWPGRLRQVHAFIRA
jgi:hypothetical protein